MSDKGNVEIGRIGFVVLVRGCTCEGKDKDLRREWRWRCGLYCLEVDEKELW
jgi:hypothetical protein